MINIIILIVILFLIIFYLHYNKEQFISSTHTQHIEFLKQKLEELKELKDKFNVKNKDGTNSSHTLLDNLIYKQALLDSIRIEEQLNRMYMWLSRGSII
jgi:hypothetical protein